MAREVGLETLAVKAQDDFYIEIQVERKNLARHRFSP
jgi:hypothetical protein